MVQPCWGRLVREGGQAWDLTACPSSQSVPLLPNFMLAGEVVRSQLPASDVMPASCHVSPL